MQPSDLTRKIDYEFHAPLAAAGYPTCLYVGSPQPFTGPELYRLAPTRYWKAPSKIIDRNGQTWDGPDCGFSAYQLWDSRWWPNDTDPNRVWLDVDMLQKDHLGRVLTWATSGPGGAGTSR